MIVSGIVLPSDFTPPSGAKHPFEHSELDQNQSSPPLLFGTQDSIFVASGSSYTSISEQTTTSSPQFLGGDLTAVRYRSSSYHFRSPDIWSCRNLNKASIHAHVRLCRRSFQLPYDPIPGTTPTVPAATLLRSPRSTHSGTRSPPVPRHRPRHVGVGQRDVYLNLLNIS